jgi:DNA-binding Lrp family transcriptional regulator
MSLRLEIAADPLGSAGGACIHQEGPVDRLARKLFHEYQANFPLVSRPFAQIAETLGTSEDAVMAMLEALQETGSLSRIGPVFRPNRLGRSTLAILAVPDERLEEVARRVSRHPGVNHVHEREHAYNLWIVVTAPSAQRLGEFLAQIEQESGCKLLVLPMKKAFKVERREGLWH